MKLSKSHFKRIIVSIIAILAIYGTYWFIFKKSPRESPDDSDKDSSKDTKEGFTTESIKWLDPPKNTKLPFGYYQIDDNQMSQIPYGYIIDPANNRNVIAKTQTAVFEAKPVAIKYTSDGYIPDGYYKVSDVSMGIIPLSPPNLKPSISSVTYRTMSNMTEKNVPLSRITNQPISGRIQVGDYVTIDNMFGASISQVNADKTYNVIYSNNSGLGKVVYAYDNGYVSDTAYYAKKYPWTSTNPLPKKMYYVDSTRSTISFLPDGNDASNCPTCYGYITNKSLILNPTDGQNNQYTQYKDMSNNLDITFHPSPQDLSIQTGNDAGIATVLDQCGNRVLLPKLKAQGDVTYYQPGAYRFGPANYVPKYEDSVYLSRTTNQPTTAEYKSAFLKTGICEVTKNSLIQNEQACNALDVNTCSSMSCCVLLGGSKCVAGSKSGPRDKTNYSDLTVRNKDHYYFQGTCYGNC